MLFIQPCSVAANHTRLWTWSGEMPFKNKEKSREYKKVWNKEYYTKNREKERKRIKGRKQELQRWFKSLKLTLKCEKCCENHPACLEFHHQDNKNKDFIISAAISQRGYSKKKILDEIKKCSILCSNCHKKLHYKRETL